MKGLNFFDGDLSLLSSRGNTIALLAQGKAEAEPFIISSVH